MLERRTATLMVMGGVCTRACRFAPSTRAIPPAGSTPRSLDNAAETVRIMDLGYVVLTSVDRDDLAGRRRIAFRELRARHPRPQPEDGRGSVDPGLSRQRRGRANGARIETGGVRP